MSPQSPKNIPQEDKDSVNVFTRSTVNIEDIVGQQIRPQQKKFLCLPQNIFGNGSCQEVKNTLFDFLEIL